MHRIRRQDFQEGHPIHYTDMESFIWSTRVNSEFDRTRTYLMKLDGKDPVAETLSVPQSFITAMYDEFPITKRDDIGRA